MYKPSSRRLVILHAYPKCIEALEHLNERKSSHFGALVTIYPYEDHFSTRYAIIFTIGVNNDRKQTNNNKPTECIESANETFRWTTE